MDKIFDVYIARKDAIRNDRSAVLSLPASPYRMLDALEKIRAVRNNEIYVQIEDCHGFDFLPPMIDQRCGLYELNALAEKLSTLDEPQRAAYQGLARMEAAKRDGSLPFSLLMDLAHSTDIAKRADLEKRQRTTSVFDKRMKHISEELSQFQTIAIAFDELTVRQMVSNVKVIDKERLLLRFKDGTEIEQMI